MLSFKSSPLAAISLAIVIISVGLLVGAHETGGEQPDDKAQASLSELRKDLKEIGLLVKDAARQGVSSAQDTTLGKSLNDLAHKAQGTFQQLAQRVQGGELKQRVLRTSEEVKQLVQSAIEQVREAVKDGNTRELIKKNLSEISQRLQEITNSLLSFFELAIRAPKDIETFGRRILGSARTASNDFTQNLPSNLNDLANQVKGAAQRVVTDLADTELGKNVGGSLGRLRKQANDARQYVGRRFSRKDNGTNKPDESEP